jgi:hypothetical protein
MLNKNAVIYVLVASNKQEEVKYVGKTIDPKDRLQTHIVGARNNKKTYVHYWINKTRREGNSIVMKIIESNLTYEEAGVREIYWIDYYKKQGFKLTNLTLGGEGCLGRSCSKETREKLRKANIGKTRSLETREKLRKAHLGKTRSLEHRENIKKSLHGKPMPEHVRQMIIGRPVSLETREKLRKANIGKTRSLETRENIRKARIGKALSLETREKLRKANIGKTVSAETREKLRKATTRSWAKRKQVKSINRPINRPM